MEEATRCWHTVTCCQQTGLVRRQIGLILTPSQQRLTPYKGNIKMPILRMPAIMAEMGYRSHASVYTDIHAGLLTHPVQIGQRSVGLPAEEIQAVNAAKIAGQTEQQIRELVNRLHAARCEKFGEPFKPTWLDRSAKVKKQAAKRRKRTGLATNSRCTE